MKIRKTDEEKIAEFLAELDQVFEKYKNDPKLEENIDAYRRKYSPSLTAEELYRRFD